MHIDVIRNLKIGIIGGGFAGLTTGIALQEIGANVTIYEQSSGNKEVGAGIGLRPASIKLFRKLGVYDAIEAVTTESKSFDILDAKGNLLASEEWPNIEENGLHHGTRLIHRRDFIDALVSQISPEVILWNYHAQSVEDFGDYNVVTFDNGATEVFDLLIGADGIRSTARKVISQDQPVFHNAHVYRSVVDYDDAEGLLTDDNVRLYIDREASALIYFIPLRHRGKKGQFSLDLTCPNSDSTWNPDVSHEDVLRMYRNFDPRLISIIENLDWENVNKRAAHDLDLQQTWNTNSIALIGDAAHAMLHHQLQGANSAIVDAGALAECLLEDNTIAEALDHYTAIRRGPVHGLQQLSRHPWQL